MIERSSRYVGIAQLRYVTPDGRDVIYFARRIIPAADPSTTATLTPTRNAPSRLDLVAASVIGDPQQFWRVCDANNALDPFELLAEAGTDLRVPTATRASS